MKKDKGLAPLVIVAILAGVIIVVVGIFYLLKNKNPSENISINPEVQIPVENKQIKKIEICKEESPSTVTLISPNGGEVYKAGEKISVKWENCNNKSPVSITLMKQKPATLYTEDEKNVVAVFKLDEEVKEDQNISPREVTLPVFDQNLQSGEYYFISLSSKSDKENVGPSYNLRDYSDKLFTINLN